ncbi:MAG: 1,6-anhydro-N-acetylmuramyl-L-alanine amidase AmpD [Gammaproteobacteria bacterium]|nr:1,6-anhydro-N-acetylmuramyl-L-alanine amidase AmpD [Gammaproteobacteria bacterium]
MTVRRAQRLRVSAADGLLAGVRQVASPNCDERPLGAVPELIVVHGISLPPGEFGGSWIEALFTNRLDPNAHPYFADMAGAKVSAHFVIGRDGAITQYVPVTRRAWHAGQSLWCGREKCNDFSIGIELEGTDERPYEAAQYDALADLVGALRAAFPSLATAPVVGHCDIAPGRKTDPGPAFDWSALALRLEQQAG